MVPEHAQSQETSFPQMMPNGNELYEFLPEEIFQLDQPIVPKSETQSYSMPTIHQTTANSTSVDNIPHQHTSYHSNEIHQQHGNSPSFIDLGGGAHPTAKYPPPSSTSHANVSHLDNTEINNNLNYQLDESHSISSMKQQHEGAVIVGSSSAYLNNNSALKFYCSENNTDKISMRKRSFEAESPKINHNNNQIQHNGGGGGSGAYQTNLIYPKRDNNCFSQFYQANNHRYSSDMYGKMPTEAYRATEKFNNFIH